MSNNLIREQHLASVQSAVKNYVDKKISAGGNILDTVPATVDGGLWYAIEDSTPVIKFFHDNHTYSLSPIIDAVSPNLTITPSSASISSGQVATATLNFLGTGSISVSYGSYDAATKTLTVTYNPHSTDNLLPVDVNLSASTGFSSQQATFYVTMLPPANPVPLISKNEFEVDDENLSLDENFNDGLHFIYHLNADFSLAINLGDTDGLSGSDFSVSVVDAEGEDVEFDYDEDTGLISFDYMPGFVVTISSEYFDTTYISIAEEE